MYKCFYTENNTERNKISARIYPWFPPTQWWMGAIHGVNIIVDGNLNLGVNIVEYSYEVTKW